MRATLPCAPRYAARRSVPHSTHLGGRGSSAAYIALLYERLTRPESGAYLRAAAYSRLCGAIRAHSKPGAGSGYADAIKLHSRRSRSKRGAAVCGAARRS